MSATAAQLTAPATARNDHRAFDPATSCGTIHDRRVYDIHEKKVLDNRGSSWLPFVYKANSDNDSKKHDGKRTSRAPTQVGGDCCDDCDSNDPRLTTLNPNHSHYILLDDGAVHVRVVP